MSSISQCSHACRHPRRVTIIAKITVGTQVDGNFDSGRLDAQVLPLDAWTPDSRQIVIPPETPAGEYIIRVTVYDWRDNTRLPVNDANELGLITLTTLTVTE